MKITLIAAIAENRALGVDGDMIYHISADLRHFKANTIGKPVIMGRRTFESLPKGALPERRNIVITTNPDYSAPNIEVVSSLEQALALVADAQEVMIIGGGRVYTDALPMADELILTVIHDNPTNVDTYFPAYPDFHVVEATEPTTDPRTGHLYEFQTLRR